MSLIDVSITQFIEEVDSSSPAPGGGSVSAFAGVIGIALARMVGHLTIPKKSFLKLDEVDQEQFQKVHNRLFELKELLLPLMSKSKTMPLIMEMP